MRGVALLVLVGCKAVEAAPDDLDSLLHFSWAQLAAGDDAALTEAMENLDAAVGGDTLTEVLDGSLTRLTEEEAALVGVTDRDPAEAAGIFLARTYACNIDELMAILVFPAQDTLYTGTYDAYSRTYDGSVDAFLSGDHAELTWSLEYEASVLGASYTAHARGMLREVHDPEGASSWLGPMLVARTFFPEPAVFQADAKSMDQDYQLELFVERSPGTILHLYGMWRQASFGTGFTTEDEGIQRILLNNLSKWDDDTEVLCAEGLPAE